MNRRRILLVFLSSILLVCFDGPLSAQSRSRDRIARRIEDSSTVPVRGNVHPFASSDHDRGRVSGSFRIERVTMVFKSTDVQQAELDKLIDEQQDASSPNYHHWLSPDEFGDRFGLSQNDVSKIVTWLESQGLTVHAVARNRRSVNFSGSARQIESAFGTSIHEYNIDGRVGRFGWKSQHASLESFSADAYLNEIGITTPLLPEENTSSGRFVGFGSGFDPVPEPEDDGVDVVAFANFMRSTKAPARGPITLTVFAGEQLFNQVGCATCHLASITTAAPGTRINGGAFTVPQALGNKVIHPYSDFLLHDIGTSDGIPVLPTSEFAVTASLMRTAPLWGLRTRNRLMHDGLSFTTREAIERHAGQASGVRARYRALSEAQKQLLLAFLDSL